MSNAVPLLEGTAASGGYLVPTQDLGLAFQRGIDRQSAVASMPGLQIRRVTGKSATLTEYVGRPTAAFVDEAADKPATGAEYAQVSLAIKKIASVIMYTEELIEDAQTDPRVLINQDVRAAFADLIDSHALGRNASGVVTGQFNSELSETTSTVELGTTGDNVALAVSSALGTIKANGYNPTGVILANDGEQYLRDRRAAVETTAPVFSNGFTDPINSLYGLPIRYTTNLQTFAGTATTGRVVGLVEISPRRSWLSESLIWLKFSDQATINVGGTDHRLWQQNKVASLWEARVGFAAHDLNRAFVAIINAA